MRKIESLEVDHLLIIALLFGILHYMTKVQVYGWLTIGFCALFALYGIHLIWQFFKK